jgi:hypothetical protein
VPAGRYSDPPAFIAALLQRLHDRGLPRASGEPLESYAARLDASPALGPDAPRIADLLIRYAEWRYGDRGDLAELERRSATL